MFELYKWNWKSQICIHQSEDNKLKAIVYNRGQLD
jgi:hypothetical protein